MPTPITDKKEMYRRLNAGLLGYTLPAWESIAEVERAVRSGGPEGRYALRFKQAGGKTVFGLTGEDVMARARALAPGEWNVTPMIDDTKRTCYAHLLDGPGGWRLHYLTTPKPCKLLPHIDGCNELHLAGLAARMYVRSVCDDLGWQTILDLVDSYPGHVIEFTAMADRHASRGPTNVIVWEVREAHSGLYEYTGGWVPK